MNGSTRYKILMWLVWIQVALLPLTIFVFVLQGEDQVWRWNVPFWTLLIGYLLGLVLWPLSWGLLESSQLKLWWIRIDFIISIIICLPIIIMLDTHSNNIVSVKGDDVLYQPPYLWGNIPVILGTKKGLLVKKQIRIPHYFGRMSDADWILDKSEGYIYINFSGGYRELVISPTDSMLYQYNEKKITAIIDSVYNVYSNSRIPLKMEFIMPNDFSRIKYWIPDNVQFYEANDSEWSASVEIHYPDNRRVVESDSVVITFRDGRRLLYHKDSLPRMSPKELQQFIYYLEKSSN